MPVLHPATGGLDLRLVGATERQHVCAERRMCLAHRRVVARLPHCSPIFLWRGTPSLLELGHRLHRFHRGICVERWERCQIAEGVGGCASCKKAESNRPQIQVSYSHGAFLWLLNDCPDDSRGAGRSDQPRWFTWMAKPCDAHVIAANAICLWSSCHLGISSTADDAAVSS